MVVDHACIVDVSFSDDAIDISITDIRSRDFSSGAKLLLLNSAGAVRVNLIEFFAKLVKLMRVDHLAENLEALSSKTVFPMEV